MNVAFNYKKMVVKNLKFHFLALASQPAAHTQHNGHCECGFSLVSTWAKLSLASVSSFCTVKKLNWIITMFFSLAWSIHELRVMPQLRLAVIKDAHSTGSLLWTQHKGLLTKSLSFHILLGNCQKTDTVKPARRTSQHEECVQDPRKQAALRPLAPAQR